VGLAIFATIAGLIAVIYAVYLIMKINTFDAGNERMKEISHAIQEGAMAFLKREYFFLIFFVIGMFILLTFTRGLVEAICYLCGSVCSVLAGFVGMRISTKSNARTTQAATQGISQALKVAFSSGTVMGMSVAGFGLLGLGILYLIVRDPNIINGFALGAKFNCFVCQSWRRNLYQGCRCWC